MTIGLARYLRLLTAFARYSLLRELAFRSNFLIKMLVEALWLGILLLFYHTVFTKTSVVAGWSEPEYLFFVGCFFALEGVMETLFLENCSEFADLIRTGDLDFFLLKPIDEQFLISCRGIDWSTAPNVLVGAVIMTTSLVRVGWQFDALQLLLFLALFTCGVAIAYSFLLILSSASIWMLRNQSLYEMWWLFTTVMRYPREIYLGTWAGPLGWIFTFIVPLLLVINVPAVSMVKVFEPPMIGFTIAVAIVLLVVSRRFLRFALRRYRSASS